MNGLNERTLRSKALFCFQTTQEHICYEEFELEVTRLTTFAKILKQQKNKGAFNIRQLLNSVIIAHNVFGLDANSLLVSVCHESLYPELITLLKVLSKHPEANVIIDINGNVVRLNEYSEDEAFIEQVKRDIQ